MKINFQKIRNYNQFLLSVAGTIGVLFLLVGGIWIAIELVGDFFYEPDDYTTGVIASSETDELMQDSLRKQVISINQMKVIDSTEQLFILPISQADLTDEEDIDDDLVDLMNYSGSSRKGNYSKMGRRANFGIFNNLILHNAKTQESEIIFDNRICVTRFLYHKNEQSKNLIIVGSVNDTNNDKFLNSNDLQKLYIYNINSKELMNVEMKKQFTTKSIFYPNDNTTIIGQFGVDRNENGKFDKYSEPQILYKIDIENKKLVQIIDEDQLNKLQNLLQGN